MAKEAKATDRSTALQPEAPVEAPARVDGVNGQDTQLVAPRREDTRERREDTRERREDTREQREDTRGRRDDNARGEAREMEARGRMLTEYGDLRRRLAELMAEASSLGAEFQELSNQLRMCPNVVTIDGLIPTNSNKAAFAQALFDTSTLVALVSEIRQTIVRKNDIQERLQDLGILDAYGQFRY